MVKNFKAIKFYTKNIFWVFLEKTLRIIFGFTVGFWVARHLGPSNFGSLNYAISIYSILAVFITLGLDGVIIQKLNESEADSRKILGSTLFLKFSFSIITFLCFNFLSYYLIRDNDLRFITIVVSSSILLNSLNISDLFFQSRTNRKLSTIPYIISLLITNLFRIILLINESELIYFAYIVVLESIIATTTGLYLLNKEEKIIQFIISKEKIKEFLKNGSVLIFASLATIFYLKIDQIMIEYFLDTYAVGIYSAAVRINEFMYFIPVAITSTFFPALLDYEKKDKQKFIRRLKNLMSLIVYVGFFISLILFFFSDIIIQFFYGIDFKKSSIILKIISFGNIFIFIDLVGGKWYLAKKYYKDIAIKNVSAAIINIILNIFLIQKYGVIGAAVSTLFSYFYLGIFYDLLQKKTSILFKIKLKSTYSF